MLLALESMTGMSMRNEVRADLKRHYAASSPAPFIFCTGDLADTSAKVLCDGKMHLYSSFWVKGEIRLYKDRERHHTTYLACLLPLKVKHMTVVDVARGMSFYAQAATAASQTVARLASSAALAFRRALETVSP